MIYKLHAELTDNERIFFHIFSIRFSVRVSRIEGAPRCLKAGPNLDLGVFTLWPSNFEQKIDKSPINSRLMLTSSTIFNTPKGAWKLWGFITKGSPLGDTLSLSCEASVGTSGSNN